MKKVGSVTYFNKGDISRNLPSSYIGKKIAVGLPGDRGLSLSSDARDPALVTESASAADKISTSTTSFEPIYLLIKSKFSRRTSISPNGSLKFRVWATSAIASSFLNLKKGIHNF